MRVQPIIRSTALLSVVCAALIGCTPKTVIVGQISDLVDNGLSAFERDDDLDLLEKALPANIKLLETMLVSDPGNGRLMVLLARLYGSYAFGFVEPRLEEVLFSSPSAVTGGPSATTLKGQVSRCYAKGRDYALAALEISAPGAADAFAHVGMIDPYLKQLGKKQVPALFWYGFNLGGWVNRSLDSIRAVSQAHIARKVMERVIQLDPAFHHAGAHLFLVAYFGSRPPMMGGSQAKAADHYETIKRLVARQYVLPDLVYGRFCLVQQQERSAFIDLMRRIAEAPARGGDLALYNAIAGRRAAIYLSAVDSLFAE